MCLVEKDVEFFAGTIILLLGTGFSLLAYWWSGKDPKGFSEPVLGNKKPTKD